MGYEELHNDQGPLMGYQEQWFEFDRNRDFVVKGILVEETDIEVLMVVHHGTWIEISIIKAETKTMMDKDIPTVDPSITHCIHTLGTPIL